MRSKIIPVSLIIAGTCVALSAQPSITIYNDNIGVVRDSVALDLKKGFNRIDYTGATSAVEPSSVLLRDPSGKVKLSIVEQSYRGDPVGQRRLLEIFEGKVIRFSSVIDGVEKIVSGRIVRAPADRGRSGEFEPIIEVDGELRTSLPGTPLFPSLGDGSILKPTLSWTLFSDADAQIDAQLSYISRGLSWVADYSLVLAEKGDDVALSGLVSLTNRTGKVFENAKIKLIAGDVSYIPPEDNLYLSRNNPFSAPAAPKVESKKFDEFHMYTLPLATTLFDQETKQVEFVSAPKVKTRRIYEYDPMPKGRANLWNERAMEGVDAYTGSVMERSSLFLSNVSVSREFKNNTENGLGVALPAGKMRFYRTDSDGQLEFVGENLINHTPKDETVRVKLGNAFDVIGEVKQLSFELDEKRNFMRESFEMEIRNRSDQDITVQAIGWLYRGSDWTITQSSAEYKRVGALKVEFSIDAEAGKTASVTYTVEYAWGKSE